MDTALRTLVQITITTKVLALTFEDMMKSLPMPADVKDMIMDMRKKLPEHNVVIDDKTLMDLKTTTPFIARKRNEMMEPTSTVVTKIVTELNKPVTPSEISLRSLVTTIDPRYKCVLKKKTTVEPQTTPQATPPAIHQIPIPIPIPMQIPFYASMPIIMPMRSYFEPVKHDHPPLYKIKKMIQEDEKKWKEENGSDKEDSLEVAYSDMSSGQSRDTDTDTDTNTDTDTDTDTDDSDYIDVGHEYYDDVIKINTGRRDNT